MPTDRTTNARSSFPKLRLAEGTLKHNQVALGVIEATLAKARADAQAINEDVLAYFIDMSIAEVRKIGRFDHEEPRQASKRKSTNVFRLVD